MDIAFVVVYNIMTPLHPKYPFPFLFSAVFLVPPFSTHRIPSTTVDYIYMLLFSKEIDSRKERRKMKNRNLILVGDPGITKWDSSIPAGTGAFHRFLFLANEKNEKIWDEGKTSLFVCRRPCLYNLVVADVVYL